MSSGERPLPGGRFNWRRDQLILEAGSNLFARVPTLLQLGDRPIVWLSSDDEGSQQLNLDVWGEGGELLFSMRDNVWQVVRPFDDLVCPPAGDSLLLRVPSKGIQLKIKFKRLTAVEVRDYLHRWSARAQETSGKALKQHAERLRANGAPDHFVQSLLESASSREMEPAERAADEADHLYEVIRQGWGGDEYALCALEARLPFPFPVVVTGSKIELGPGHMTFRYCSMIEAGTGFMIQ